jgi:hypothetical protein
MKIFNILNNYKQLEVHIIAIFTIMTDNFNDGYAESVVRSLSKSLLKKE